MAEIYKSQFSGQEIDERLELIPELQEGVEAAQQAADGKYTKPASGIPMTDLSDEVQEAIEEGGGQADWEQTDTTAPDYIKNKPSIPTHVVRFVQQFLSDSERIQARANIGAGTYSKPAAGIPASDLAPGVIPTVPTDVVKYSSQSLTDAQKTQARSNIGAAAASALTALETAIAAKYTKPSSGIPETDLAAGVQSALALARTSIQSLADYYDKTEVDSLLAAISSEQYVDVATLPTASADTLGKIYLVGPTNGVYDRYYTSYDGSAYSWVAAGTTEINLANYATKAELSQLSQEMVTKRTGRNLFDYSGAELNKRLTASGGLANDTNYLVTDYIPVIEGENYYISDVGSSLTTSQYICFFSPQKVFVSSEHYTSPRNTLVTIPTGCAYMRCTILVAPLTKLQIERGNKRGDYLPYTKIGGYVPDVDVPFVYHSAIADNSVDNNKILDKSVSAEKVLFIKSINLLNKNDANVALSKYINPASGLLANNTGYNTTGYIRVESGKTYYFGSTDAQNNANFYCLFDRNFGYVSGGSSVSSVTIPDGVFFIRFSISTSVWSGKKAQMTADSLQPYSEYELRLDIPVETFKPCINALGQSGFSKTFASKLSSGDLFQLEDYPYFQLKGIVMSFSCELTSFSSLIVGKGYQKRLGEYIQIDGTNVQLITCDLSGNETIRDTSAHGLTISDFLRVSLVYMGDGQVQYVISTKSGMFNKTLSWRYIGEYEPFVKSIGTTATEVKLSIGSTDLKKSVWAFGDSYMSISSERWPGVLNTMGLLNIMVNALSGINSTNMIVDARRAFAFGAPLFAIWGLGMNDASDADSSTPANTWVTAIETFIALCKANDTEPILATIPCIPSKNHEGKNAWVRSSGYRYIDFAKAVNGQTYTSGSSNWYDGMLSTDNVHPTALGAQALASQLLQDLPEIMQFNS